MVTFSMRNPLNYATCLGITMQPSYSVSSDTAGTYTFSFTDLITMSVATSTPSYFSDATSNYVLSTPTASLSPTTSCKSSGTNFKLGPPATSSFSTNITYDIKTGPLNIPINTFSISPSECNDLNPTYTSTFSSHFASIDSSG